MSLPMPWVEKIFLKLALTFGREFTDRWDESSLEDVKADWAHELRGLQQNPAAIAHGLEICVTGKPPTVHDFKAACLRYVAHVPALPSPPADPERVAAEIAKLAQSSRAQNVDHKAWARTLKVRHAAGEKLNRNQIACYQAALGEKQCGIR